MNAFGRKSTKTAVAAAITQKILSTMASGIVAVADNVRNGWKTDLLAIASFALAALSVLWPIPSENERHPDEESENKGKPDP